jgi:hypothetical protein
MELAMPEETNPADVAAGAYGPGPGLTTIVPLKATTGSNLMGQYEEMAEDTQNVTEIVKSNFLPAFIDDPKLDVREIKDPPKWNGNQQDIRIRRVGERDTVRATHYDQIGVIHLMTCKTGWIKIVESPDRADIAAAPPVHSYDQVELAPLIAGTWP